MLGKLLKYEFKGLFGRLSVIYLAWLGIGVLMGFSLRNTDIGLSGGILITAFCIASLVAVIMTLGVIIDERFTKNVLGDEGYFTLTIPASTDELLLSKTLSAVVWLVASLVISGIAFVGFMLIGVKDLDLSQDFFNVLTASQTLKVAIMCLEVLLVVVLWTTRFVVKLYASICTGRMFNKNQSLLAVVAYIVYSVIETYFLKLVGKIIGGTTEFYLNFGVTGYESNGTSKFIIQNDVTAVVIAVIVSIILCAAYYFVTRYLMKNKLNLQ